MKEEHLGAATAAARQGLGRRRGGLTSTILLTAADENTAIAVEVRPGPAHDAPRLKPMLEQTTTRLNHVDQVVGDNAFDGAAQRPAYVAIGAAAVIPATANRVNPEPRDREAWWAANLHLTGRVGSCFTRSDEVMGRMKQESCDGQIPGHPD